MREGAGAGEVREVTGPSHVGVISLWYPLTNITDADIMLMGKLCVCACVRVWVCVLGGGMVGWRDGCTWSQKTWA